MGTKAGLGVAFEKRLDHGVARAGHREVQAVVDDRAHIASPDRELGERRGNVDFGERGGGPGNRLPGRGYPGGQRLEDFEFAGQRLVGGGGELLFEFGQDNRGVAARAGKGLAMNEAVVAGYRRFVGRRHLDEIAEHVVVADLQRGDAGFVDISLLQIGDQTPAAVAKLAEFVELRVVPRRHEAAVTGEQRKVGSQRLVERLDRRVVPGEGGGRAIDLSGRGGRPAVDEPGQAPGAGQRLADRGEVARPAAAEREARHRPFQIGTGGEYLPAGGPQRGVHGEMLHRVLASGDRLAVGQRRAEAFRERPGAGAGDGQVYDREQRAAAFAGERSGYLEIASCRGVDFHSRPGSEAPRRIDARQPALLGQRDIVERRAAGGNLGAREGAEGVERANAVMGFEPPPAGNAVETGARQRGGQPAPAFQGGADFHPPPQPVGQDQLTRIDPRHRLGNHAGIERLGLESAGRNVDPGETENPLGLGERGEVVVAPRLEQGIFGQRAGRDDPDDLAGDDRLGAPFARLRGILRLFANRHPKTLADEALQIGIGGVDRHPAHRHIRSPVTTAAGQRNVERLCGGDRVLEEQLVEVAHSVEQEATRVGVLDGEVLRHHRRCRGGTRTTVLPAAFDGRARAPLFGLRS